MSSEKTKNCSTCRFQSSVKRARPTEDALNNMESMIIPVEDEDKSLYFCKSKSGEYAGKEIGFEPVVCSVWEEENRSHITKADAMIAAWEARQKARQ